MLTKPSIRNLSYKKLKSKCLDKQLLRHDALTQEETWRRDGSSEDELETQYKRDSPRNNPPTRFDSDDFENRPLVTKSPIIMSSEMHFSIGDKTIKII